MADAQILRPSTELELSRLPPQAPEATGQQEPDHQQDSHEHLHDIKVQRIARDEQRGDGSASMKKTRRIRLMASSLQPGATFSS